MFKRATNANSHIQQGLSSLRVAPAPCLGSKRTALLAFGLLLAWSVQGQMTQGSSSQGGIAAPLSSQSESQSEALLPAGAPRGQANDRMSNSDDGTESDAAFSSDQIIAILQQNPSIATQLKEQISSHLQQQGVQTSAGDISDDTLYNQIQSNPDVRNSVSTFLRARGFTSTSPSSASRSGNGSGQDERSLQYSGSADASTSPRSYPGTSASDASSQRAHDGSLLRPALDVSRTHDSNAKDSDTDHLSTAVPHVVPRTTPYNLQSLHDLYAQLPSQIEPLKRFGSNVFADRSTSAPGRGATGRDTPLDVPMGPDYIVGPGDTVAVNIWGGVTQSIQRTIDREGRLLLPDVGVVQVAGMPLHQVETLLTQRFNQQFRDVRVAVTVSQLRSVRIYLVGDVQRPGGYDVSALATPLSALYAAGGPTAVGSLRVVKHYRGNQLLETIDLYDFLLHGVQLQTVRFEAGDTLMVPPAGPQVAISGAVKRPAIYELKSTNESQPQTEMLDSLLDDAGGVTVAASMSHITIERIVDHKARETVTLKTDTEDGRAAIATFSVKDGDRINISPILPYSERAIYLEGHVVRPGRMPYAEGMKLSDVLRSYQDMLPEPASRGRIIRLVPPDMHAQALDFSVSDVMVGNTNLELRPFDTIRILGRYEEDAPTVSIQGEVLEPGLYPLSRDMTAAQLVRMAGGFKRDALLESADLTSYVVSNGSRVDGNVATIRIGAAVDGNDTGADVRLNPGDVLTVRQITGWNDIGESVTVDGQVMYPGTYGFREGARLSSILKRAGGFRDTAYPEGAVLVREQVRELEEKSRDELVRQIETNSAAARLSPTLGSSDGPATVQMIKAQQDEVLTQLKSHPAAGRLVVHVSADIDSWANTDVDIELRKGDKLTIPKRPGFVLVTGQVYNATALTFTPGKTAGWYLSRAGGTNTTANRKEVFIVRANGSVIGRRSSGAFTSNVLSTQLDPGDVVVVPQKIIGSSVFWRNLMTTAQLASSIAITAAVAGI